MKKLELNQMENLLGGQKQKLKNADDGSSGAGGPSANCYISIAGALVFGTGAIIGAATGGVGAIAFAMAGSYFGWGMTAYTCS
ncbi:hypothetical protein [Flavobacterium sp. ov086]|uniref:hypothetical protein n=1 Tax=Flavobacterium sp. ov086 TaxID=1761785 RepID=UPI000B6D6FE7|nr:hypothetical protein [Flavobacterium sp. ov086]SNR39457.1 hypothetical protein SAMN04487979_104332 [Flavobacterium sp. ov086]